MNDIKGYITINVLLLIFVIGVQAIRIHNNINDSTLEVIQACTAQESK